MPKAKNAKGPISHLLVPEMDWIQQSCKRRFIMGFTTLCVCVSCLAGPCELFACSFLGRWAVLSKHIKAIHSISKPTFPVFLLFQGEAPHFLMIIMLQAAHLWNQKLKRTKLEIWSFEHPLRYFCCIFGIAFFLGLRLKTRTTKQQAARRLCCYWRTWSFKPFRAAGPLPLLI